MPHYADLRLIDQAEHPSISISSILQHGIQHKLDITHTGVHPILVISKTLHFVRLGIFTLKICQVIQIEEGEFSLVVPGPKRLIGMVDRTNDIAMAGQFTVQREVAAADAQPTVRKDHQGIRTTCAFRVPELHVYLTIGTGGRVTLYPGGIGKGK